MTTIMHYQNNDEYLSDDGKTLKKDALYRGEWVYRNSKGQVRDHDKMRAAVAFRNNLELR